MSEIAQLTTRIPLLVSSLIMAIFLAAIDATVVATAMPTVIGNLGGIALYSWVFSAYLLTSTTTVPIFGRLSDLYGRKLIYIFGILVFLLGSALSGAAQSMEQLILFRALQGLGAGAVMPMALTIIGDVFSIEERARLQGLFSGVWGVSAIAGPAVGGLVTTAISWRWIFFLNIPFGLLSVLLIWFAYREHLQRREHVIDYTGAIALTAGVTALLLGLLQVGLDNDWTSYRAVTLFSVAGVLVGYFIWHESSFSEPMLPLGLFKQPLITIANLGMLASSAAMLGVTTYVPLFAQGVQGGTAIDAGIVLAPMSIAWPLGSIITGRLIIKLGYKTAVVTGSALLVVGAVLLLFLSSGASKIHIIAATSLIGLGMGFTNSTFLISVQNAVDWGQRGIATAIVTFSRTLGGAVGVSLLGTVLSAQLLSSGLFAGQGQGAAEPRGSLAAANVLLDPASRLSVAPNALQAMQLALSDSLHAVYWLVLVITAIGFIAAVAFPRGVHPPVGEPSEAAEAAGTP